MRDLDERLPRILDDLAGEIRPDPSLRDRVIGRSRRRRALTSATTVLVAVGLVAGALVAARSVLDAPGQTIGGDGPSPSAVIEPTETFEGIWPETDAKALADVQASVDEGHQPWRTDPEFTASVLTVDLFGWDPNAAQAEIVASSDDALTIHLRNPSFAEGVPPVVAVMRQLGRTGPTGIWSVVGVSSELIELGWAHRSGGASHVYSGRLTDLYDGATVIFEVLGGAASDSPTGTVPLNVDAFVLEIPPSNDAARRVLWIQVVDATGAALGAVAAPLDPVVAGATGASGPTGDGATGSSGTIGVTGSDGEPAPFTIPLEVGQMRDAILEAALAHDVDALRPLLDPNTFAYNFGDGSDPTPEWEADPSVLDTLAAILQMPPAIRHTEESGDFYVWPYFMEADLSSLTAEEYALLETIGISEADVRGMIEFGSYIGPRTTIAPDGTWLNYVTGGA
jgi:hypothetical protein